MNKYDIKNRVQSMVRHFYLKKMGGMTRGRIAITLHETIHNELPDWINMDVHERCSCINILAEEFKYLRNMSRESIELLVMANENV